MSQKGTAPAWLLWSRSDGPLLSAIVGEMSAYELIALVPELDRFLTAMLVLRAWPRGSVLDWVARSAGVGLAVVPTTFVDDDVDRSQPHRRALLGRLVADLAARGVDEALAHDLAARMRFEVPRLLGLRRPIFNRGPSPP